MDDDPVVFLNPIRAEDVVGEIRLRFLIKNILLVFGLKVMDSDLGIYFSLSFGSI